MNKHRLWLGLFFTLFSLLFLLVGTVGAAPGDDPIVQLSSGQSEYNASQNVLITVNISNPTTHTIRILKWFTPINGLEEPIFVVKVNGESVPYTGAIYKRPAATGNDYISLKSGKSVTYTVNLGDFYDLSTSGQYEVSFFAASYHLYNQKGNATFEPDSLTSESITLKVEGRAAKGKPTPPPPPPDGGTSFNACTVTQQSKLIAARQQASVYASGAEDYLLGSLVTSRYLEWFGVFDPARYGTATTHFTSISNAWDNAGVNFDCKCKRDYYAYVYPDKPYYIYLCRVFWLAPLAGTDSQAGTLIHEMSHFYNVASTVDFVYGQTAARNLAITNPDNAVMNADNHEYFAENTPYLP